MARQMIRQQGAPMILEVQSAYNADAIERGRRDWYSYEAQVLALAPAGIGTDTIQIEADANFYLHKLAYFADIAAAAQTDSTRVLPLTTIQLVDTGSGRQLMANPIPIPSIFGTGELPHTIPYPRLLMRNTTLQVTFVNFSAATTYNIRLAFIGFKVYPGG